MKRLVQKALPISLWYAVNTLLFIYILTYGAARFIEHTPVSYRAAARLMWAIGRSTQLPIPQDPAWLLLAVFFIMSLLGSGYWLLLNILKRWSLEELYGRTLDAIKWSFRTFFASCIVWATAGISIPLVLPGDINPYWDFSSQFVIAQIVLGMVILLGAPIVVLDAKRLSSDDFSHWHRVRWPGWRPALVFWLGWAVVGALSFSVGLLGRSFLDIPLSIVWYVAYLFLSGALLSAFLGRQDFGGLVKELRRRANLRFIVAWFLLDLRMTIIVLWLLPPLVVGSVADVLLLPLYQNAASHACQTDGRLLSIIFTLIRILPKNWAVVLPSFYVLVLMIQGRYLILFDQDSIQMSAINETFT